MNTFTKRSRLLQLQRRVAITLAVALDGFAITLASAQHGTLPLSDVGQNHHCALQKAAPGMGHSNRSCVQTQGTFLQRHIDSGYLARGCPTGMEFRGLSRVSCTDRVNARGELGAAYHATLCCGYARAAPAYLPTPTPPPPPMPEYGNPKLIRNLPVTGPGNLQCPPLGVWLERPAAMVQHPYVRAIAGNVDQRCHKPPHLSPLGFSRVNFHSCSEDARGIQYGLVTHADYLCYP